MSLRAQETNLKYWLSLTWSRDFNMMQIKVRDNQKMYIFKLVSLKSLDHVRKKNFNSKILISKQIAAKSKQIEIKQNLSIYHWKLLKYLESI